MNYSSKFTCSVETFKNNQVEQEVSPQLTT